MRKKTIYYWSPFFTKIATIHAVINSAGSLMKYSNNYECYIINAIGEYYEYLDQIKIKQIKLYNFFKKNLKSIFPKYGFIRSRFSYLLIFILCFFPLKKLLRVQKPDYIIIHLITSLPLILFTLNKFSTKCILRISGYPRLNFFRIFLWKLALKNVYKITCPTVGTYNYLVKLDLVNKEKIIILRDPILDISEIIKKKKEKIENSKSEFLFSAGRLTKQKNFIFLINAFSVIEKRYNNLNLLIAGEGEEKEKLVRLIKNKKLENKIFLIGHIKNVFKYMNKCKYYVSSSMWEDPGFVLIEAAGCRTLLISSDCDNGPKEFIEENKCGYLFKKNDINSFVNKFQECNEEPLNLKKIKLFNALKKSRLFTKYYHFKKLNNILI